MLEEPMKSTAPCGGGDSLSAVSNARMSLSHRLLEGALAAGKERTTRSEKPAKSTAHTQRRIMVKSHPVNLMRKFTTEIYVPRQPALGAQPMNGGEKALQPSEGLFAFQRN